MTVSVQKRFLFLRLSSFFPFQTLLSRQTAIPAKHIVFQFVRGKIEEACKWKQMRSPSRAPNFSSLSFSLQKWGMSGKCECLPGIYEVRVSSSGPHRRFLLRHKPAESAEALKQPPQASPLSPFFFFLHFFSSPRSSHLPLTVVPPLPCPLCQLSESASRPISPTRT